VAPSTPAQSLPSSVAPISILFPLTSSPFVSPAPAAPGAILPLQRGRPLGSPFRGSASTRAAMATVLDQDATVSVADTVQALGASSSRADHVFAWDQLVRELDPLESDDRPMLAAEFSALYRIPVPPDCLGTLGQPRMFADQLLVHPAFYPALLDRANARYSGTVGGPGRICWVSRRS